MLDGSVLISINIMIRIKIMLDGETYCIVAVFKLNKQVWLESKAVASWMQTMT